MDESKSQQDCDGAQKMLKTLRGIINRLTPEKFDALMKRVDDLKVENEETLNAVVKLIIDKALSDESHCMIYAKMCLHMKEVMVVSQNGGCYVNFHKLLMKQCQREFENNELLKNKEAEGQQWGQELEEEEAHYHLLGIVRLIGELFNLNMVPEPVVHSCAVALIKDERESSLESLCKLLSTIGKGLDTEAGRSNLNSYFGFVCHLLKENKTSVRIRCVLWDLYDLRKNNWVPRRREEAPKTKEVPQEVRETVKAEQPQLRDDKKQEGGQDAGRVAEKEKSDCGGKRKQVSKGDSSSAPRPQKGKCLGKRPIKAMSETEPVAVRQEEREQIDQAKCAGTKTVEHKNSSNQPEKVAEEASLPLETGETAPCSEAMEKEDCDEGEVRDSLKKLLQDKGSNHDIEDWIQNHLSTKQRSSEGFVKILMQSVCESVVVICGVHKVDAHGLLQRAALLRKYITSEQQQLLALDVLKELMVSMGHPRCLLRMFFDLLLDGDVVKDTTLFKWELSTDAETRASLGSFFVFLRKAVTQIALRH